MSAVAKRVLITGVYGLVGNVIYRHLCQFPSRYTVYGLSRRAAASARLPQPHLRPVPAERLVIADVADMAALQTAVQGMDTVVHMAANPNGDAEWDSLLQNNIIGSYNVFEACRRAGVRRVVYASTIQVALGYGKDEPYASLLRDDVGSEPPQGFKPVTHLQPTRPLNLYAASKVFGEALAHTYAYSHGLSCICLRIGGVADPEPPDFPGVRALWCSQRDIAQIARLCIDAPDSVRFDVFHCLSRSPSNLADIQHARDVLGYEPQDAMPLR